MADLPFAATVTQHGTPHLSHSAHPPSLFHRIDDLEGATIVTSALEVKVAQAPAGMAQACAAAKQGQSDLVVSWIDPFALVLPTSSPDPPPAFTVCVA
jgi:hypothetical protein